LGWRGGTLAPLAANRLTNTLATASFFLSSIWMSGYGIAGAAPSGNLFFTTGNSAPGTYDGVRNIQQSVAKVGPQLVNLLGIFNPAIQWTWRMPTFRQGACSSCHASCGPVPFLAVAAQRRNDVFA
jgi:hypothetical protein